MGGRGASAGSRPRVPLWLCGCGGGAPGALGGARSSVTGEHPPVKNYSGKRVREALQATWLKRRACHSRGAHVASRRPPGCAACRVLCPAPQAPARGLSAESLAPWAAAPPSAACRVPASAPEPPSSRDAPEQHSLSLALGPRRVHLLLGRLVRLPGGAGARRRPLPPELPGSPCVPLRLPAVRSASVHGDGAVAAASVSPDASCSRRPRGLPLL